MALVLPHSIFFHIQKTGGAWVRRAIAQAGIPAVEAGNSSDPAENQHNTHRAVNTRGKFLFAFVRHPLSWYASFWSYRMLNGWRVDAPLDACLSVDFVAFMERVLRWFPRGHLWRRYEWYVGPEPGVLDFVGKTENLASDLIQALRLAGERFDEGKIRSTPRQNVSRVSPVYSAPLRRAVLESEREAIERFGYSDGLEHTG